MIMTEWYIYITSSRWLIKGFWYAALFIRARLGKNPSCRLYWCFLTDFPRLFFVGIPRELSLGCAGLWSIKKGTILGLSFGCVTNCAIELECIHFLSCEALSSRLDFCIFQSLHVSILLEIYSYVQTRFLKPMRIGVLVLLRIFSLRSCSWADKREISHQPVFTTVIGSHEAPTSRFLPSGRIFQMQHCEDQFGEPL